MKSNHGFRYCILFAALVTAAGCAGQEKNALLEQARYAYNAARNDPLVMENASLELAKAEENLLTAQELWEEEAEKASVEHYAYLARQQTAIARETAQLEKAQQAVADADAARARVLLDVRAREAEAARQQAASTQRELEEVRRHAEEQARMAQVQELEEARKRAEEQARMAQARQQELEEERKRASGLEEELAQLKARPTERGMVITLGDVLFDLDKADLNPGANLVMDRLAAFLKDHEERRILVEGFTDSTGPEDYNMQLSERRARAVRQALMDRGIAGERVEVRGYGEGFPVATNETIAGRQQNRRVEIVFSDEKGQLPGRR